MSEIVWQTPPESVGGGKWATFTAELHRNPNTWALAATKTVPRLAYYLRDEYDLDTKHVRTSAGTFEIYARWIPLPDRKAGA